MSSSGCGCTKLAAAVAAAAALVLNVRVKRSFMKDQREVVLTLLYAPNIL